MSRLLVHPVLDGFEGASYKRVQKVQLFRGGPSLYARVAQSVRAHA